MSSDFSQEAQARWDAIPAWAQQKILHNAWCAHCREGTLLQLQGGAMIAGDLILSGTCARCGGKVVRLLEGEEPAPAARLKGPASSRTPRLRVLAPEAAARPTGGGKSRPAKKADESPVYQLKVTLRGAKPPIGRRIQVRGSTTLGKLHRILQVVMGWTDSHLHQFIVGAVYYGVPHPDWGDLEVKSERRIKVGEIVAEEKDRFVYEYDFGDSWEHEMLVEKVLEAEPGVRYPCCLTGKRACPPEDVGGVWGYAEFLEIIRAPKHPDYKARRRWVGGVFDPEAFDLEAVNRALKRL